MSEYAILQYKLLTGEEVISEVVAWPDDSNDVGKLILRNPLTIKFDMEQTGYYLMPFMANQICEDCEIGLDPYSIISEAHPSDQMIMKYKKITEYLMGDADDPDFYIDDIPEFLH